MADPPLLLMDEPFGALDPLTRTIICSEFKQLDELKRKTMVMVTHDVVEAFELGDRICLMDQGKIVQLGTPFQLLFEPANEFVSSFLVHQRLQLELKAIKIKDIWQFLPASDDHESESFLSNDINLWEALASLLQLRSKTLRLSDRRGQYKTAGYTEIMAAYNDFKIRQYE
jgi:osmoprotectant transport system ATP-binding protein